MSRIGWKLNIIILIIIGIKTAPGQGNIQTGFLRDESDEALSFPKIYCGKQRKFVKRITYGKICKSDFKRQVV